jgi:hypothetical protein
MKVLLKTDLKRAEGDGNWDDHGSRPAWEKS